jgi:hypothetical protein
VKYLKFVPESDLEFVMKDGNVIKIASYKSIYFDIEPEQNSGGGDMEKTLKFGGATYKVTLKDNYHNFSSVCFAVIHSKGIIIFDNDSKKEIKYANETIHSNVWEHYADYVRRISFWDLNYVGILFLGMGMSVVAENQIGIVEFDVGTGIFLDKKRDLENMESNIIETDIKLNPDGTITMNAAGISHTFTGW